MELLAQSHHHHVLLLRRRHHLLLLRSSTFFFIVLVLDLLIRIALLSLLISALNFLDDDWNFLNILNRGEDLVCSLLPV